MEPYKSRKAIIKSRAADRKRPREEDSSVTAPPLKLPVISSSVGVPRPTAPVTVLPTVSVPGVSVPPPLSTPSVASTRPATNPGPEIPTSSTSDMLQADAGLDLELSLRRKKSHDLNAEDPLGSVEKEVEHVAMSSEADMTTKAGTKGDPTPDAHPDIGNPQTSTQGVHQSFVENASSSDTGTFGFINIPSTSETKVSDHEPHVDKGDPHIGVDKSSGIPP